MWGEGNGCTLLLAIVFGLYAGLRRSSPTSAVSGSVSTGGKDFKEASTKLQSPIPDLRDPNRDPDLIDMRNEGSLLPARWEAKSLQKTPRSDAEACD